MKLTLKKPVSHGSEKVAELTFREEVVAGDLRGLKVSALADPSVDDLLKIAGRLCAQPDLVMNQLGPEDLGEVAAYVYSFFGSGQRTGSAP
jgi:hypothetical protein